MTGCSDCNSSAEDASEQVVQIAIAQQGMQVTGCSDCNSSAEDASEQVVHNSIAQQELRLSQRSGRLVRCIFIKRYIYRGEMSL